MMPPVAYGDGFTEHDTTEENLRTLQGWLRRYGRPLAHYPDKNSIFRMAGPAALPEQLRGEKARSQFGRALRELGIEWIAAHSPQAKGRIERLFETLQDRLVKEMRLAGIDSLQGANHFLEMGFLPEWEQRFTVAGRNPRNAHRRLEQEQHLEEILSVRVTRKVAQDHRDLRNKYRDPKTQSNPNTMCLHITLGGNPGSGHFYLAKNRTFLLCVDTVRCPEAKRA